MVGRGWPSPPYDHHRPLGQELHLMATKSSVPTTKLVAIVEKLGFTVKVKANSMKVWPADGSSKKSLDLTTNKHGRTAQVLLVGFTRDEGTLLLAKPPATTATQVIDLSDEKLALRFFFKACKELMAASKPASSPAPVAPPVVEEQPVVEQVAASA